MKNHYSFLILLFLSLSIYAQSPEKMSYQAVVRDANNTLVANQTVGMRISILQSTITGIVVYTETHSVDTNMNGLVSLEIGNGSSSDDFSTIDWSAGPYFIKTETDPTGGSSYTISGTSQLMSVPYAMYAKSSGSSIPGPAGFDGNSSSWMSDTDISFNNGIMSQGNAPGRFHIDNNLTPWAGTNSTHQLIIDDFDTNGNDYTDWINFIDPYDIITVRSQEFPNRVMHFTVLPLIPPNAQNPDDFPLYTGPFVGAVFVEDYFYLRLKLIDSSPQSPPGDPLDTSAFDIDNPCYISYVKSGSVGATGPAALRGLDGNSALWEWGGEANFNNPTVGQFRMEDALQGGFGGGNLFINTTDWLNSVSTPQVTNAMKEWLLNIEINDILVIRNYNNYDQFVNLQDFKY